MPTPAVTALPPGWVAGPVPGVSPDVAAVQQADDLVEAAAPRRRDRGRLREYARAVLGFAAGEHQTYDHYLVRLRGLEDQPVVVLFTGFEPELGLVPAELVGGKHEGVVEEPVVETRRFGAAEGYRAVAYLAGEGGIRVEAGYAWTDPDTGWTLAASALFVSTAAYLAAEAEVDEVVGSIRLGEEPK